MVRRMALLLANITLVSLVTLAATAQAQHAVVAIPDQQIVKLASSQPAYSRECRVAAKAHDGHTALRTLRRALKQGRTVKVLAIGSSSTAGIGASSALATYPVRLENDLEVTFKGADFDVVNRGVSGEVGLGACTRMKREVEELKPDLVVWQVGTNDAMTHADVDEFKVNLTRTLQWLAKQNIDVVLIDPQFTERLAADEHYIKVVHAIADVARDERVRLVRRFTAMADLVHEKGESAVLSSDRFHLNDLGYRCMAEYAASAIVAGIIQAQVEPAALKASGPHF